MILSNQSEHLIIFLNSSAHCPNTSGKHQLREGCLYIFLITVQHLVDFLVISLLHKLYIFCIHLNNIGNDTLYLFCQLNQQRWKDFWNVESRTVNMHRKWFRRYISNLPWVQFSLMLIKAAMSFFRLPSVYMRSKWPGPSLYKSVHNLGMFSVFWSSSTTTHNNTPRVPG